MRYRDFDDMLKNKAESLPDHAALRYGEKTWTFRELYEAVCRKAEEYRHRAVAPLMLARYWQEREEEGEARSHD